MKNILLDKKSKNLKDKLINLSKSKFFLITLALVFVIATVFIVITFRTENKIQRYILEKKFDHAISAARNYLNNSKDIDISKLLAEALFLKSLIITDENEVKKLKEEAKNILKEIIKKEEFSSKIFFILGYILSEESEERDVAVDYLKKSLKWNKKDGKIGNYINKRIIIIGTTPLKFNDIYERLAFSLFKLKRLRESLNYYNMALKSNPKTLHYFFIALINKELKKYIEAKKYLNIVLKTENNSSIKEKCYLLMGHIEFYLKNYEKAEDFYKKTIKINSQSAVSYYFLSKIYRKRGKMRLHRKLLRKAAELGDERAQRRARGYGIPRRRRG